MDALLQDSIYLKSERMDQVDVHGKTFEKLITAAQIQKRVDEIGEMINRDYEGKQPLFLGVLNGAFLFTADIFKRVTLECEISFIRVSSYNGTGSTGKVRNLIGINEDLEGRDIIVVEDIVDTGDTALFLYNELKKHNAGSVRLATMLFKPKALRQDVSPDYIGFEIDPKFVVGYGLDYDGLGRNLNDIFALKSE